MNPMEVQTQFKGDINTLGVQVKIWIPDPQEIASRASGDPFAYPITPVTSNPMVLNLVLNLAPALEALKNPAAREFRKEPFLIDEPKPVFKPIAQEKPVSIEKPVLQEQPIPTEKPSVMEKLVFDSGKKAVSEKYARLLI